MKALKLWNAVMKLTEYVLVFQLWAICLVLLLQVILRYFFNMPLIWSEELTIYLLTWITFLGVSYGIHKRTHVRMNSLEKMLPKQLRKCVLILIDVAFGVACAASLYPSWEYLMMMSESRSPGMRLNYGFVYVCILIGFILALLSLTADVVRLASDDFPNDM